MGCRNWMLACLLTIVPLSCADDGDTTSAGEEGGSGTSQGDATTTMGTTTAGTTTMGTVTSASSTSSTSSTQSDTGPAQCTCGGPDAPTACPDGLGNCSEEGDGAECCDGEGLLWECIENDIGVVWQRAKC